MARLPQKAVTREELASDRPGVPAIGEGDPPHPGPTREKAAEEKGMGVLESLLVGVCVHVCALVWACLCAYIGCQLPFLN